jgi:tRNA nucleotidyltransferase (CCA-adding enzyme)
MRHIIDLIANTIKDTKFENKVFIAGGYPRDLELGKSPKDLDLCVNLPDINSGMELAEFLQEKLDCSKVVTFPKFGTAKVTLDGIDVEMVATRSEKYNLRSRNPEVSSASLYEDVARRDFTINSLMINISTGELIDYLNGKQDIYDRIIKTTSDPDTIFQEDALRMLRAIRFASRLGFSIEQNTYNSIIKNAKKLYTISRERIRDEFIKILESENVLSGLRYLYSTGILAYMIPEFKKVCKITNMGIHHKHIKDLWNHTLTVVNNSKPTWQHRLAGLLHDIGKVSTMTKQGDNVHFYGHQKVSEKVTKRFMNSYKFKIKDVELVSLGVLFHMSVYESLSEKTIRKYVDIYGRNEFLFCLDVCEADVSYRNTTRLKFVNDLREFVVNDEFFKKEEKVKPLINGDELMVLFNLKPSKRVGTLIAIQIERLYENPNITREEMLEILESKVN